MIEKLFSHKLSVIIPVYRQAKTIRKDIKRIDRVLQQIRYPHEIIVVVDGYDVATFKAVKGIILPHVKVTTYIKNQGKGHAVRLGMSKATGDYVGFIDAGMEIDPNGISMLLEHLEWYNADIIVGSKRHPVSVLHYPLGRKILSTVYQHIITLLFRIKVRDTQAGIKIYKKKVLDQILPRLIVKRYAFDLEMLVVANYLGFRRIYEAPIKLKYNFEDIIHASTINNILNILVDTLAIFYRLNIIHYYNSTNRKNWKI